MFGKVTLEEIIIDRARTDDPSKEFDESKWDGLVTIHMCRFPRLYPTIRNEILKSTTHREFMTLCDLTDGFTKF